MFKSEFSIKAYNILLQRLSERYVNQYLETFVDQYYYNVIGPLCEQVQNMFNYKELIKQLSISLQLTVEKLTIDTWSKRNALQSIPQLALKLFDNLKNINQDSVLEIAKYNVLKVLSFFIDGVSKYIRQKHQLPTQSLAQFIDIWQNVQVDVANIAIQALQNSDNFDLYSDYESINYLFEITAKLLETTYDHQVYQQQREILPQQYNFIHKQAADIILQNSMQITQNIIQMIINAGRTRFQHFKQDDLLVIDSLKPAAELVSRIAKLEQGIEQQLELTARELLDDFLNNRMQLNSNDMEQQCQLFTGIMLYRRIIPRPDIQQQVLISVVSLRNSCYLSEIVFEEAAKLIISIIYENRQYTGSVQIQDINVSEEQIIKQCQDQQECAQNLIKLLIQQYMMNDRTTFVYRMLSGILSRPVRSREISNQLQTLLLRQSINLLLKNYNESQKAGMVTLIRTIIQEQNQNDDIYTQISDIIRNDESYRKIPQMIIQNYQVGRQYAESAISVIDMLIDQIYTINQELLEALMYLTTRLLEVDLSLSQALFKVLNKLNLDIFITNCQQVIYPVLQLFGQQLQTPSLELANAIVDSLTFIDKLTQFYQNKQISCDIQNEQILQFAILLINNFEQYNIQFINQNNIYNKNCSNLILFSGVFILGNILSKIDKQNFTDQVVLQILMYIQQPMNKLYCTQDIQFMNVQDSETKRMLLLFYAQLYYQYCKIIQYLCEYNIDSQQFQQPIYQIDKTKLFVVAFSALWAIQDKQNQVGYKWRYQLSFSCLSGAQILYKQKQMYEQNQLSYIIILLLILAQQNIISQRTIKSFQSPIVNFDILQNAQDQEMIQVFSQIFGDMCSKAILQAITESNQLMPFWSGVERTKYGELIRNVGNDEGYILYKEYDLINQLKQILFQNGEIQKLPLEWQEYVQKEYQQIDQMFSDRSIL